jgi:hypothetical protein
VVYSATGSVDGGATGLLVNTATVTAPAGTTELDPEDNIAGDADALETPLFCDGFESGSVGGWSGAMP